MHSTLQKEGNTEFFISLKRQSAFVKKTRFGSIVSENCLNFLEVGQGLDGFTVIRVESAMQAC